MVHRIDIGRKRSGIEFQGLLDPAALFEVRRHLQGLAASGRPVRLVLKIGTEVDPACVDALRSLESVELVAESSFLARWLGVRTAEVHE